MKRVWIRRLVPAAVVAVVLAISYFVPAAGDIGAGPVQAALHPNCGRFGYGYHGGKHNFICPNRPFPGATPGAQPINPARPAVNPAGAPTQAAPVPTGGASSSAARSVAPGVVLSAPVSQSVTQWRAFTDLILSEFS